MSRLLHPIHSTTRYNAPCEQGRQGEDGVTARDRNPEDHSQAARAPESPRGSLGGVTCHLSRVQLARSPRCPGSSPKGNTALPSRRDGTMSEHEISLPGYAVASSQSSMPARWPKAGRQLRMSTPQRLESHRAARADIGCQASASLDLHAVSLTQDGERLVEVRTRK